MYIILYIYTYPSVVVVSAARIVQTKWYFRDFHRAPPPLPIIHNNIWLPYRLLLVNVFSPLLSFVFFSHLYLSSARTPADLRIRYKFNSVADHLTKGVIKNGRGHRVQMRAIRVGTRVVFVRLFGFFFYYYFPLSLSDDRLRRVFSIRLSTAAFVRVWWTVNEYISTGVRHAAGLGHKFSPRVLYFILFYGCIGKLSHERIITIEFLFILFFQRIHNV